MTPSPAPIDGPVRTAHPDSLDNEPLLTCPFVLCAIVGSLIGLEAFHVSACAQMKQMWTGRIMETEATVFVPAGLLRPPGSGALNKQLAAAAPEVSVRLAGPAGTKGRRQQIHRRSFLVHFPIG